MIKNIMNNIGAKKETGGMSKHWVQNGEEAMLVERTPEEETKMWQKVAARLSNDKLKQAIKNREGKELNPVGKIKLEVAKSELAKRPIEEEEEVREDILPSKISTDDFSYKQLEDYASGLEEALETQKDKFTDETRASTEKELEAVKKALLKRQAEKKPE